MDHLLLAALAVFLIYQLRAREQRQRIALLAQYLRPYQIEQLMERLTDGYQRVLAESDPQRRDMLWRQHGASEAALAEQVARLADDFSRVPEPPARVSRIPLPFAARWLPQSCFDFRQLLALHARALAEAVRQDTGGTAQQRSYTLLAEILLLQHSCHWFCRSFAVASARMMMRHQTRHDQALQAVAPATREAYRLLVGV